MSVKFDDIPVVEATTVNETEKPKNSTDDLDSFLSGYKTRMEVPSTPLGNSPISNSGNVNPIPGSINVSHNPQGSAPVLEYYKTGKKAGQPKPPKAPGQKGYTPPVPTQIQSSVLISGSMFIMMIDILFPLVIGGLNNMLTKTKIDTDKMKMTATQKSELAPIGEAVARELNISGSPTVLLSISLVGIYSANLLMLRNQAIADDLKKKEKEKNISHPGEQKDGSFSYH